MSVKPITPQEVTKKKAEQFPDFVFEAFNELIAKHYNGRYSCFRQSEVADLMAAKGRVTTAFLFKEKFLDVEEVYRAAGWKVEFDQPGYNETHPATFKFSK